MVGDMLGAAVEGEAPKHIAREFAEFATVLKLRTIPGLFGDDWDFGRFTDDTQMLIGVAQWLAEGPNREPRRLLELFAQNYEPWRRYGPGTRRILERFMELPDEWQGLATMAYPLGSYGNGSAMRVAPVGLACRHSMQDLVQTAVTSSVVTHAHPLALQAAALQAHAVACAVNAPPGAFDVPGFFRTAHVILDWFRNDRHHDTREFEHAFGILENALAKDLSCVETADKTGCWVDAVESVPAAIYCFLRHRESFADVIKAAFYLGGDTDTIASMAGAIAGAYQGESAIPAEWLKVVREPQWTVERLRALAQRLAPPP